MNPPIWPLVVTTGALGLLVALEVYAAYLRNKATRRLHALLEEWRDAVRQEEAKRLAHQEALSAESESRKAGIAEIRALQLELQTIYREMFSVPPTT